MVTIIINANERREPHLPSPAVHEIPETDLIDCHRTMYTDSPEV